MSIGIHIGLTSFDANVAKSAFSYCMSYAVSGTAFDKSLQSDDSLRSAFYRKFGSSGLECLGRSALDHHSVCQFEALGERAKRAPGDGAAALGPLAKLDRPYVLLPFESKKRPSIRASNCYLISGPALVSELLAMASITGLNIQSGDLSDEQAEAINKGHGAPDLIELQAAWLMLYEAARLSVANGTALVLA